MGRGKYADVIDDLPRIKAENPQYQAKVDAKKREILEEIGDALSSSALAALYVTARQDKEKIDEQLSVANLELEAVSQLLVDRYEIDDTASVKLDNGMSVSVQIEPYAVTMDKEANWKWCQDNGFARAMTLPWQTLNAITKERLLAGEPEPDGVIAHQRPKIVLRKV